MKRYSWILTLIFVSILANARDIKYVFYMIGDGMGVNQVFATERYLGSLIANPGNKSLNMTQFPHLGLSHTYSKSSGVTDSAAGGTALSCFEKTVNGVIGMDSAKVVPLKSIAEMARDKNMKVGIVTSVSIDHATPAAFYAHVPDRGMYYEIGKQLATSGFDFFGGAWFLNPKGKKGNETDLRSIVEDNGYTVLKGYNDYLKNGKKHSKIILTQPNTSGSLPYAIDRNESDLTLAQTTQAAVDFLYNRDKRRGFFLMVEGGKIDWACHGNDGGTAINEVKDFDDAIAVVFDFYQKHPDETMIVVTADHETGGLALGNSDYSNHLERFKHQKCSQDKLSTIIIEALNDSTKNFSFEDMKLILKDNLGFFEDIIISESQYEQLAKAYVKTVAGKNADVKNEYATVELLSAIAIGILNENSKMGWTTGAHSGGAVPIFSIGRGTEKLNGVMENNEIPARMAEIAGY